MTIVAAADGSALGNPGPAGWAWYVDEDHWASGGWPHGTNNMGELTAVLRLLQQTAHLDEDLYVYCDSRYAIDSITKWMPGWKRNGWVKRDKKPVLNLEIMQALDLAMQGRRVRFEWVKGHAGHPLNEAADRLANTAALAFKEGREPDAGPGFGVAAAPTREREDGQLDLFAATEPPPVGAVETVVGLERTLLREEVRRDPAALGALLHPDWREIGTSGRLWSRAEVLAGPPSLGETSLEVVEARQVTADVVLLVWRARSARGVRLRSSLWIQEDGAWRQLFAQGTQAAD